MKILLAIDGSEYSRMAINFIVSRKTLIASKPDIEVLNAQLKPLHISSVQARRMVLSHHAEEAEKILQRARTQLRKAGLEPTGRYAVGHPATEIAARAESNSADLLILGSHGHSALAGLLLGSVTNEVLVRTKRPMLIIRGRTGNYPDSLRVGIAIDGSRYGREAMKYVLKHMPLFGANPKLTLIHVVQSYALTVVPTIVGYTMRPLSDVQIERIQTEALERAARPVRPLLEKAGIDADEVLLVGNAGEELSRYARKKLDLLVLGSHGYGAFKAAVMGSVATRVTASCAVPLLLVR